MGLHAHPRGWAWVLALVLAFTVGWPTGARAASPTARPAATPVVGPPVTLDGHWAVAGTSGFDITSDGSSITGSSVAGIRFAGSFEDGVARVRFWSGPSFAKADPEDRGTAVMQLGPDGNLLFVRWSNEKPSTSSLPSAFTATRVVPILTMPAQSWFTAANLQTATFLAEALQVPLETVVAYLMLSTLNVTDFIESMKAWPLFLSVAEVWDAQHGIKPRSAQ
jgi:hypothetical protein